GRIGGSIPQINVTIRSNFLSQIGWSDDGSRLFGYRGNSVVTLNPQTFRVIDSIVFAMGWISYLNDLNRFYAFDRRDSATAIYSFALDSIAIGSAAIEKMHFATTLLNPKMFVEPST